MTKFKHNKKKNSAFLYEVLIKELTKAVISKNIDLQLKLTRLIKESFTRNSMLYRELKLYRAITHTKEVGILTAEKIVNEVKNRHRDIDKKQLLSEQNKLARKIKKILSDEAFSNFVPNYKNLASISQIFNQNVSVKAKILLENEIVAKMSMKEGREKMVPVNNIVFKSFIKRFNEEYRGKLLNEQKQLLNKFITSFENNGLELKVYLNEEIGRLKKELKSNFSREEFLTDSHMLSNSKKVLKKLEEYKEELPTQTMVEEIIKIQGLVQEMKTDVN